MLFMSEMQLKKKFYYLNWTAKHRNLLPHKPVELQQAVL